MKLRALVYNRDFQGGSLLWIYTHVRAPAYSIGTAAATLISFSTDGIW